MRFKNILVTWKSLCFTYNLSLFPNWLIKAHHHKMEIYTQLIHDNNFCRLCTDNVCERRDKFVMITQPGIFTVKETFDTKRCPLIKNSLHRFGSVHRL